MDEIRIPCRAEVGLRRILPLPVSAGEGLLTEPTAATRSWRRELVFMPTAAVRDTRRDPLKWVMESGRSLAPLIVPIGNL
jgi:hypothetical protein